MLASRMLLRASGANLYIPVQIRAFSLARIALEPAKKVAPEPVAPTRKAAVKAVKTPVGTLKKEPVAPAQPVVKRRVLTDKERTAAAKEKEREKVRAAKVKEKERAARLKEKERAQAAKEKEKEKKLKKAEKPYPLPPKRPSTGFLLFFTDTRVANSGLGVSEAASQAGAAWKELPESQKQPYLKKAESEREKYKAEVAKWVSSLSLAELNAARQNKEPGTRDEAALSQLPKRPSNAYAHFLKEAVSRPDVLEKIDAAVKKSSGAGGHPARIGLMGKTTAAIWRAMSDKEKEPYVKKAAQEKQSYDKNFGSTIATQKEAWAAAA
ncbi:hypothetical protein BDV93DRAFT_508240 [Ceratobasidium sp. AG-I]|nr:hypothetical protein BDV93DRAFT_508240 [Ceratobasidium sp. AG-I]